MKKIFAILLSLTLLLGISSPAFAAEHDDVEKALQLIEKTNREIDEKIAKAVAEADKLYAEYLNDIKKLKEGDRVVSELTKVKNDKQEKYDELTQNFNEKLDKIIENVYNETLAMSAKTIEKAAQSGVIAECSWTLVRFANRWVWIDPVRVVKVPK
jgi:Skp family chaperone for outer membrane proteins